MLATLCEGLVEKQQRHYSRTLDGFTFEVDESSGANAGLIVAELNSTPKISLIRNLRGWDAKSAIWPRWLTSICCGIRMRIGRQ
jgi:CYTH domain-containing protein